MKKIAVIGSRSFNNYELLKDTLDKYDYFDGIDFIISGGAKGADKLAERYAKENGIKIKIFKPEWGKYGKKAGIIRNKKIVEEADIVLAFWDGKSKGTEFTINYANKLGKEMEVIIIRED